MASPFITGPFVPVAMLNLIRAVLGIHHHRFNLSVKRSRLRIVGSDSNRAALDFAKLHDLVGDDARHVHRNGKSHARIAVGGTDEGGDNANEIALKIDERSTRTAGIEGRIGLNEIFKLLDSNVAPM